MKKIYLVFMLSIVAFLVSSCDMDKLPYNQIERGEYLASMTDVRNNRISFYSSNRTITTGSYVLTPEIQGDAFNAVLGFSNTYGNMYLWEFLPSTDYFSSHWGSFYTMISRANYFIEGINAFSQSAAEDLSAEEKLELDLYLSEAYFMRSYSYFELTKRFCVDYNPSTADSDLGLPLQMVYDPTPKRDSYPSRSSLKVTYDTITGDLKRSEEYMTKAIAGLEAVTSTSYTELKTYAKGIALNPYISIDAITAFKARVALQMEDFTTAYTAATSLISGGKYPLINTNNPTAYQDMWHYDTGTETIWQIKMTSLDDMGSQTGSIFIGVVASSKDYIPSADLLDLYDIDSDIRFGAYFGEYNLTVSSGASGDIYFFNKYPGNPNISTDSRAQFVNQSKPFRISEMYLIAAEAYARQATPNLTNASKYLNDLQTARIVDHTAGSYTTVNSLMSELRNERQRELVGEGFRIMDLKRWGLGVKRSESQNDNLILFPGQSNTNKLDKSADDFRMVWPIPKAEMDANPQLSGQQNRGY